MPFLDGEKLDEGDGPERQGRINCKSWIALIIAPGDIVWQGNGGINSVLLDGNLTERSHAVRKESIGLDSARRTSDHYATQIIFRHA